MKIVSDDADHVTSAPSPGARRINFGILSPVAEHDPRLATDVVSGFVLGQIFDTPYVATRAGGSFPLLLDTITAEPSAREAPVYSAAVRPGIQFSDGTSVTAELIAASLSRSPVMENKATVASTGNRVLFTLDGPSAHFDLFLTQGNCAIVLEKDGRLLGTGPFMLDESTRDPETIRLIRNPRYRGEVEIDEIVFSTYPADKDGLPTRLIEALRAGEVDVTASLTVTDAFIHQLTSVTPVMYPSNCTGILFFNTERIADTRIRRALTAFVDPSEIARVSYERNAAPFVASGLLPPMMGRSGDLLAFDPAEGERLLSNAPWRPRELSLLVPWSPRPYLPHPLPAAQAIRRQLARGGVDIHLIETTSSVDFFGRLNRGEYDLALAGWIADTPDPADFFDALLWSKMSEGEHHWNHSRWRSSEMDRALMAFRVAPTESNQNEIVRLIREQAPLVPLIYGQSAILHSRRVRNLAVSAAGVPILASARC